MTLGATDIGIMKVRNVLGYPSTDLGTLCSLGEEWINKWSKYKPVRNDFEHNRPSNWWKAGDGSCGLSFEEFDTALELLQAIVSGATFWQYQPPRGGNYNEPFRLLDFVGYSSDARNPIQCLDIPNPFYRDTYPTMSVVMERLSVNESYNLQLTDFGFKKTLSAYYPAVVVAKVPTGSEVLKELGFMTTNVNVENHTGDGIEIPRANFAKNNSYYVVYCLSSVKQTTFGSQTTTGTFIPVPASNALQIVEVKEGGLTIVLRGEWNNGTVSYSISATNQIPDTTASMTDVKLDIVYLDYGIDRNYMIDGERTVTLSDITGIAYGSTRELNGQYRDMLPDYSNKSLGGKLVLRYRYNGGVNTLTEELGAQV